MPPPPAEPSELRAARGGTIVVPAVVPGISLTRRDDGPRAAVVAVLVDAKFLAEVPEERAEVVPWPTRSKRG